jgi:hypothetical protein
MRGTHETVLSGTTRTARDVQANPSDPRRNIDKEVARRFGVSKEPVAFRLLNQPFVSFVVLTLLLVFAQLSRASISGAFSGIVTDSSGAVIPAVTVVL